MKVNDLIEKLKEYNQNAEVKVVVAAQPQDFEITFGSSEGVTKENAEDVCFMANTESESESY